MTTPDTLTARLAEFVTTTPTASIDAAVIKAAARALTDTLGVGLGGREDHASAIAAEAVAATAGTPQSTLWARGERATAADAAFLNAIQAHVLDYDDSSLNLRGHPSAILVSVALAVGEVANASGADVLAAYAIGLEVSAKLSPALGPDHYFRGWHTSSTVGIFGATAVAARLLKLDEIQLRNAWGIAASHAAGLTRNFGTMTKALHIGNAARNGIVSAELAKGGFTGDTEIFDGKGGFVDVYTGFKASAPSPQPGPSPDRELTGSPRVRGEGELKLAEQIERLGKPWELIDPGLYVKRWPCCYASHRPIAGMLDMIARHKLAAEDIERVDVGFLPGQTHPLNHTRPKNELEAKFSIEYPIAAAILDKRVGLDSFADDQVERPAAQALMEKVGRFAIPDEKSYNGLSGYNVIRVSTRGGTIEEKITGTPGAPYDPMTDDDRKEKFVSCALRVMTKEKAAALYARAAGIESMGNVRELWT